MTITVSTILEALDAWAPCGTAAAWDNVGLLVGSGGRPVSRVLTALDVTPAVIEQAAACGADLLVSHHPVIFAPLRRLDDAHPAALLARHGVACIALHTNLDRAPGGVNDCLAAALGCRDVQTPADDGRPPRLPPDGDLCRLGRLPVPMTSAAFAAHVARSLRLPRGVLQWQDGGGTVQTVGLCAGAGGDFVPALLARADAVVTGELHYHEWPRPMGAPAGTLIAAGHFYTERDIAGILAAYLSHRFPSLSVEPAQETCPYTIL